MRQDYPLKEYGGLGLRSIGKNRALNVSGDMGIQLEMRDGLTLLIGTSKADEARFILTSWGNTMETGNNNPQHHPQ